MIDAKELRKGNIVSDKGNQRDEQYAVVQELTRWLVKLRGLPDNNPLTRKYEQITPIPLTPELLEACGFVEGRSDYSTECIVYINTIRLFQHEDNLYSLYAYNDHKVYISFLHELQNLFYFLTNTELEVNLNKEKV